MSEYTRNNSMVACVVAVVIIGAAITGILAATSPGGGFSFGQREAYTTFSFRENADDPPPLVDVVISLSTGQINVTFVDDPTLVYDITVEVPNASLAERGNPVVTYDDNQVQLDYPTGSVTVRLGNASAYALSIDLSTGNTLIDLNEYCRFRDIIVSLDTGNAEIDMSGSSMLAENATMAVSVTTGNIDMTLAAPPATGIKFTGLVAVGSVDIVTTTWNKVSDCIAQTDNYGTATLTLDATATVNTGSVNAYLK